MDVAETCTACGLHDIDRVLVRPAPRFLTRVWARGVGAMTLPRGIYVAPALLHGDPETLARLVRHELVHVRQWRELGMLRFLWRYLTEYIRGRLAGRSHVQSYLDISLEREARSVSSH